MPLITTATHTLKSGQSVTVRQALLEACLAKEATYGAHGVFSVGEVGEHDVTVEGAGLNEESTG